MGLSRSTFTYASAKWNDSRVCVCAELNAFLSHACIEHFFFTFNFVFIVRHLVLVTFLFFCASISTYSTAHAYKYVIIEVNAALSEFRSWILSFYQNASGRLSVTLSHSRTNRINENVLHIWMSCTRCARHCLVNLCVHHGHSHARTHWTRTHETNEKINGKVKEMGRRFLSIYYVCLRCAVCAHLAA